MRRDEAWVRAWASVAGTFNSKVPDCTRYADACLAAFDERFPQTRHEAMWCGTPVSQLTADEREEMEAHLGLAKADRSAKRQDPQGLGPKGESGGARQGICPNDTGV